MMFYFMSVSRGLALNIIPLIICFIAVQLGIPSAQAQPKQSETPAGKPLKLPWQEEPLLPLQPIKKRSKESQKQIDATAWYMTGQLLQGRNDFRGALAAYKKSIQIDPNMVAAYQAVVPLAFSLNLTPEGIKYAEIAVKLDPHDYRLLRQLGIFMLSKRNIPEAIKYLSQAVKSKNLDKHSVVHILLQRDLAVIYKTIGKKKEAADAYTVIFDALKDPAKYHLDIRARSIMDADTRTSFQTVGEAFLADKRYVLATAAFEEAAKAPRGKPALLSYNLAQVYHATGKHIKGLGELQKYFNAKLATKGKGAYQLLADILKSLGKEKELLAKVESLSKTDSQNVPLQFYLAKLYIDQNRLDDAEKIYLKVLPRSKNADGYLGLVKIYRQQKNAEKLLLALENVTLNTTDTTERDKELVLISKQKELVEKLIALGEKWSAGDEPQLKFAQAYLLAKITAEAEITEPTVKFYRYALKARPGQASTLYDELGGYLLISQKYDEAAKVFREAINTPAIAGSKPNFLFRISQAYEFGGQTKEALEAIREARKIIPTVSLLHYQEAWIYYHSRQYDKAIKMFEEVINKYPTSTTIVRRCRSSLSNLYVQKGEIKKGMVILEKVYQDDPEDIGVNNDLGYLYADNDMHLEKAEAMIRKALNADPTNAAYLDSIAWVLYKRGKYQEALTYMKKAVLKPTGGDATLFEHLGDIQSKLNNKEEAKKAYQQALKDAKKTKPIDEKQIKKLEQKLK